MKPHIYTIKVTEKMKNALQTAAARDKEKSLSAFIVKVCRMMRGYMDRLHMTGAERGSKYKKDGIPKVDMRINMPPDIRLKLKHMKCDLNTYSSAQILREILEIYLFLRKEHGENLERFLIRWNGQWMDRIDPRRCRQIKL